MTKFLSVMGVTALMVVFCVAGNAKAEEAKHEEGADAGPSVVFVELNPLILPIIGDRGVMQMVSLVVSVEVDSEEKAEQVRKFSPRLADAFLSDLYGTFGNVANANGGNVPISFIKERLNMLSNKVLGDHVVDDVLLQVMQKRAT